MDRKQIQEILPHRAPMLLVDEVEKLADGSVQGSYTVPRDAHFVQGHFPGNPVVPGVILCEMMGQACCLLIEPDPGATPFFTSMDRVKFRRVVRPGDKVITTARLTKSRAPFYFVSCTASVDDRVCASGEFSFAVTQANQ